MEWRRVEASAGIAAPNWPRMKQGVVLVVEVGRMVERMCRVVGEEWSMAMSPPTWTRKRSLRAWWRMVDWGWEGVVLAVGFVWVVGGFYLVELLVEVVHVSEDAERGAEERETLEVVFDEVGEMFVEAMVEVVGVAEDCWEDEVVVAFLRCGTVRLGWPLVHDVLMEKLVTVKGHDHLHLHVHGWTEA